MANKLLAIYASGGITSAESNAITVDFLSIKIGSSAIEIKETSSNLDFGGVKATNIVAGTATGHVIEYDQMNTALGLKADSSHAHVSSDITSFTGDVRTAAVTQVITNGVTITAPSEDAVFDALALKLDADLKGANSGVAELDSNGTVPLDQLPAISITDVNVVVSEVAQLALTVQEGDVAIRTDLSKSYIALNADNVDMGDWQELLSPADAVTTVNGASGTVVLDADDLDYDQATPGNWTLASGSNIELTLDEVGSRLAANETAIGSNTSHASSDGSSHADVATNSSHVAGDGSDHADVATNTSHSSGDGSDHADVASNTSAISALQGGGDKSLTNGEGSAITIRQLVYIKNADGKVYKASAALVDQDATLGLVSDASIDAAAAGEISIKPGSIIVGFTAEALGARYVSGTAGALTATPPVHNAGDDVYRVGRFISATEFLFAPEHIVSHV